MIKIAINGANGHMGQTLARSIEQTGDMTVIAGIDINPGAIKNTFPVFPAYSDLPETPDVIIDFSRPEALQGLLEFASEKNIGVVLATTGYTDNDKMMIAKFAGHIPVFYSANMSLGVNLQIELAKKAAGILGDKFDIEIVEKHHNLK
ncbi:4-hydroxy-tetrahydrodipicolinate reductase, partial [Christensenellaceae bacterium OttesenSCG-928-K19]|nr:4-hydroxy-tetrahydrodipicolinate reductase [Christensenellaceae bacterium OttesenSCG-928-K19]